MLETFIKHQDIWDDCYLGYVIIPNKIKTASYEGIVQSIERKEEYNFYPWLNTKEHIALPNKGLKEIGRDKFIASFLRMAKEAMQQGMGKNLPNSLLKIIAEDFLVKFSKPLCFSNFSDSGWNPVTGHSRDQFLSVVDKDWVGMWLSCDDE